MPWLKKHWLLPWTSKADKGRKPGLFVFLLYHLLPFGPPAYLCKPSCWPLQNLRNPSHLSSRLKADIGLWPNVEVNLHPSQKKIPARADHLPLSTITQGVRLHLGVKVIVTWEPSSSSTNKDFFWSPCRTRAESSLMTHAMPKPLLIYYLYLSTPAPILLLKPFCYPEYGLRLTRHLYLLFFPWSHID